MVELTQEDVNAVADVIQDRYPPELIQAVEMEKTFDHSGEECLFIYVYMDKRTTPEDLGEGLLGLPSLMRDALRDDLKSLFPYVHLMGEKTND